MLLSAVAKVKQQFHIYHRSTGTAANLQYAPRQQYTVTSLQIFRSVCDSGQPDLILKLNQLQSCCCFVCMERGMMEQ